MRGWVVDVDIPTETGVASSHVVSITCTTTGRKNGRKDTMGMREG